MNLRRQWLPYYCNKSLYGVHQLTQYFTYAHIGVFPYHFAFKEGHSVNMVLKLLSKLFFDGSPDVTQIVTLLGTYQLHSCVTLQKQKQ